MIAPFRLKFCASVALLVFPSFPASAQAPIPLLADNYLEQGAATMIADSRHGEFTFSREIYDRTGLTAAHKSLPIDTMVRVTNQANGQSVDVRVNDRLAADAAEVIAVSRAAAQRIGMVQTGRADVALSSTRQRAVVAEQRIEPIKPNAERPLIRLTPVSAAAATSAEKIQPAPEKKPQPFLTPVAGIPPRPEAEPKPEPAPQQPAAAGGFRVQFGAFAQKQNALVLQAELQGKGIEAMVLKRDGEVLHRVVSQRNFGDPKDAKTWADRLVAQQGVEQTVVTR